MLFDVPVIAPARGLDPAWLDYNARLTMAFHHPRAEGGADAG